MAGAQVPRCQPLKVFPSSVLHSLHLLRPFYNCQCSVHWLIPCTWLG